MIDSDFSLLISELNAEPTFAEMDSDSCCASATIMVIKTLPFESSLLIFSFWLNERVHHQ